MRVHPSYRNEENSVALIAEQMLLGILMGNPSSINDVFEIVRPEMFGYPLHQRIADLIWSDYPRGVAHDLLTITRELGNDWFVNEREKRSHLAGLVLDVIVFDPEETRRFAFTVKQAWNDRRIDAIMTGPGSQSDKAQAMADINREIARDRDSKVVKLSSALDGALARMDETFKLGGGLRGLATGLTKIDNCLCGLEDGGLYVLAGRPGMGKTSAALTMALNIAQSGKRVLFFSLEMSAEQIAHRVNARYANVSIYAQKIKPSLDDFDRIADARKALADVPLDIVDCSGVTAQQIVSKCFSLPPPRRPDIVIVDHLGIVAARDQRTPRVYQVGEMTAAFKGLAKDMKCPVLLLHQLNRGVESRDDKRPSLADLRDSGSVEQDADVVMLLYRQEYYLSRGIEQREGEADDKYDTRCRMREEQRKSCAGKADIIVAKNRQGREACVSLHFDASRQVFENEEVPQ